MTAVAFTINGKAVNVEAEPDTALLWVVREHLKLTGTKYGCGSGLCGACTVHIDGKAVRSCQTQMSTVGGKKVTTIEGLSPNSSHALQKAWIVEQVPQCGYCQSGQIMQAAELLAKNKKPRASRSSLTWTATFVAAAPIRALFAPSSAPLGRAEP
jgi:isoquinoline 1-oxidoreductase alpha subunit